MNARSDRAAHAWVGRFIVGAVIAWGWIDLALGRREARR